MDITPIIPENYNIITGYSKGSFLINNIRHSENIIISKHEIWPWNCFDIKNLNLAEFDIIISDVKKLAVNERVILLVGTGSTHQHISHNIIQRLAQDNIFMDIMTTDAACRTYNILLSEDREVYAALLKL